jgi:2-iminobutanoate/2-iminopropanoate deaminase
MNEDQSQIIQDRLSNRSSAGQSLSFQYVVDPAAPPALGPYTPAVVANGITFVSAQAGVLPGTSVSPKSFAEECRLAFSNLKATLDAAGATLAEVVKVTVLYTDASYLETINIAFSDFWPSNPPARTALIVQLAGERRIAVDAIAVRSASTNIA